jgi:hypothetical protein
MMLTCSSSARLFCYLVSPVSLIFEKLCVQVSTDHFVGCAFRDALSLSLPSSSLFDTRLRMVTQWQWGGLESLQSLIRDER